MSAYTMLYYFFFFNDTATTEIYTLSLHDALPISRRVGPTGKAYGLDMTDEMLALANENKRKAGADNVEFLKGEIEHIVGDRKSTRLNSSHDQISYAVFCLKKKNKSKYTGLWSVAC